MKRTLQWVAVLSVVVGLSGSAEARMRGKWMQAGTDAEPHARHVAALNLTEAQQEAFEGIYNNLQKEMIRKRADVGVAEVELREILTRDPVDMKAAEDKVRQIASTQADIRILHLKAGEEFRGQLTPEQQARFDDLDHSAFLGMEGGAGMGPRGRMGAGGKGMMAGRSGCPMMKAPDTGTDAKEEARPAEAPAADSAHQH